MLHSLSRAPSSSGAGSSMLPPFICQSLESALATSDPNTLSMEQWADAMREAPLDKATMDSLVMNWLVVEGYQSAAEQFQQESGAKSSVPLSSISARTSVRSALSDGRVDDAMSELERLLPTLLEQHPALLLQLQQQQLVELIRADKVDEALSFARSHLRAGSAAEAPALHALEGIMSLLAFSALPAAHNPMAHLLDHRARAQLANTVNDAILEGQFACKESALLRTAKHALHTQNVLATYMQFPKLPLDATAAAGAASAAASNSHAAGSSAAATAAAASSSSSPFSAPTSGSLLDPASIFEAVAQREAAARRTAMETAEMSAVVAALEREKAARSQGAAVRRARHHILNAMRSAGVGAIGQPRSSAAVSARSVSLLSPQQAQHAHGFSRRPQQAQQQHAQQQHPEPEEEEEEEDSEEEDEDQEEEEEEEEQDVSME